ncbi:hypothetical protein COU53_00090 [Candidatus Pacearchaeota archaeon CG10_big_fil_rev_8_21_14_0_10_30_48]|nr:MAG: hypothetical protein COU53_00090 [Candidatus Pacearchaeota archaeon CG10_big_fil_rev_8_21_14_0_10_30_48]
MKSKKAVGHVEVILSFVIFIGFLTFLFFIFRPFDLISNNSLVDSVFLNMKEELGTKVSIVSISLSEQALINISGENCFGIIDASDFLTETNCDANEKIIVRDKKNDLRDVHINAPKPTKIEIELKNAGEDKFYTILCSEDLIEANTPLIGCQNIGEEGTDYDLGIINEKEVWSNKSLTAFKIAYEEDYPSLKTKIVPEGSDFGFKLWALDNSDTLLLEAGVSPEGTRVDAKTIPIDVLEEDGTIKKRTITIISW